MAKRTRTRSFPNARTLPEALSLRIEPTASGCWEWLGARRAAGYGIFTWRGRSNCAHRWVWRVFVGTDIEGLELDHLCRNRACVNPDHLEPVTHGENIRRSAPYIARGMDNHNGAKTHCPQGHAYDEANTYRHDGRRKCRICSAAAVARHREKVASGA